MTITKLAVTSTLVKATVRIGLTETGSYVTTDLTLSRKDEGVSEAMRTLENLVLRTAKEHVGGAAERAEIERLADERVGLIIDKERDRLVRDAQASAERRERDASTRVDRAENKVMDREREITRLSEVVDKQRRELFALRNPGQEQES